MSARPAQPAEQEAEPAPDRVCDWRTYILLKAGYPAELAWRLAVRPAHEVDLHVAADLVLVSHCTPELAARILL